MNDYQYLIALALIEQDGKRLLPLGGKSIVNTIKPNGNPGEIGSNLALQLLLRVFQKSESAPLRRSNGDKSLIMIQIPMISMQEQIPLLKANWINSGNSDDLLKSLGKLCQGIWSIDFTKEGGVKFLKI